MVEDLLVKQRAISSKYQFAYAKAQTVPASQIPPEMPDTLPVPLIEFTDQIRNKIGGTPSEDPKLGHWVPRLL